MKIGFAKQWLCPALASSNLQYFLSSLRVGGAPVLATSMHTHIQMICQSPYLWDKAAERLHSSRTLFQKKVILVHESVSLFLSTVSFLYPPGHKNDKHKNRQRM